MGGIAGSEPREFAEDLKKTLRTERFGRKVQWYDRLESTNDVAARLAVEGAAEGTLVVADEQVAGRGREGRTWYSPIHLGVYFSLILRPATGSRTAPLFTFLAAVALVEVIRETSRLSATIRWPNDVLIREKKVAGILAEGRSHSGRIRDLVIGVGWNLRHRPEDFPPALRPRATSLMAEGGVPVSRVRLLARYLETWEGWHRSFLREGSGPLLAAWRRLSPESDGCWVKVHDGTTIRTGWTRGVDPDGSLLVVDERGVVEPIRFGEVRSVLEVRS